MPKIPEHTPESFDEWLRRALKTYPPEQQLKFIEKLERIVADFYGEIL